MQNRMMPNAQRYARKNKYRRVWRKVISILACLVVFCTTYALILPAITMEKAANCDLEEHTHSENCYTRIVAEQTASLACTYESLGVHSHTADCNDADGNIICANADYVVHAHDASCYDEAQTLICQLPEVQGHTHSEGCYETVATQSHVHDEACYTAERGDLICQTEEAEGHAHGADCYVQSENPVCQQEETPGHTHGETCNESVLICTDTDEAHVHEEICYETQLVCTVQESEGHAHVAECYEQRLTCALEESEGHQHTDACYAQISALTCALSEEAVDDTVLVCTEVTAETHVHSDSCFVTAETTTDVETLTCGIEESEEHTHTDLCYGTWELVCELSEHTHDLICYADATADLETAEDWEKSFAHAELTGVWAEDVLAIAETQLGYTESTKNYIVLEDGETIKGYTRYGAWYGDSYGDWCAMFVSFCLNYAGVEDMPLESGCQRWIEALSDEGVGLYIPADGYTPQPGDLIFFDYENDNWADHVGLVKTLEGESLTTIEGNSSDQVKSKTYELSSAAIVGYASLPVQLTEEEQAEVDNVIALIDALPSADEIDARLAEYEAAGDTEGGEAYYEEVSQQVAEAYHYYDLLSDTQRAKVTNADKLMELEYIWSVTTYSSVITSDTPTPTWYTSTKDFVELNLYDYNYNINNYWNEDKKYPGFQWNGGAYSKADYRYTSSDYAAADDGIPNALTDRYYIDSIDFGNSIITNFQYQGSDYAKSTTSTAVGKLYNNSGASSTGKINWLWYDGSDYASTTNRPVGFSVQVQQDGSTVYTQSIANKLQDGYPALLDGTSLKYLFTNGTAVTKQNTSSIDGLFQQNSVTGEYSYNSRTNHAQYNNNFFTLYEEIITPNFITYPFGNFLPLNTISDTTQATQVGAFNQNGGMKKYVEGIIADLQADIARDDDNNGTEADYGDTSRSQLITMLQEYRENWNWYPSNKYGTDLTWDNLSPAMAIRDYFDGTTGGDTPSADLTFLTQEHLDRMYNIDWDVATNFFFGMEMKMTFMQPKDGYTGNDTNGDGESDYPMEFYFTGDDDVWVFIDDVLFLDLTGIHRHVGGKIDFVNGKVYYYELDVENGGDVSDEPYAWYSFATLMRAAGMSDTEIDEVLEPIDSAGNRPFKDYTTHTFNFYYLERGSGSSVCRLNFNFPLLKQNSITVTKENITVNGSGAEVDAEVMGNPDYYFNIVTSDNELFVGPDSVTGITDYTILDSSGKEVGTGTTDAYGIFTLKAGQTAVFEGIKENEGKYFVQELIKAEDNGQYPTVEINGVTTRYNDLIDWSYRKYFSDSDNDNQTGPYGHKWYGRSGYNTDSSSNSSFYFEQQNHVNVDTLGKLSISKVLEGTDTDKTFDMEVTLDGVKLPVGAKYTLDGVEQQVTTEGIITLAPGQTAVIPNIISGTKFTVRETNGGSYTVTYSAENADEMTNSGTSISGVVRTATTVSVTVINAEHGTSVEIPGTKTFRTGGGDMAHSYTFTLEQVTDSTGATLAENGITLTENAEFTGDRHDFSFVLSYYKHNLASIPSTFYYRITETVVDSNSLANDQSFVAEVKVDEDGSGGIQAELVKIHGSSTMSADFVNTLTGDLSIEKFVDGGTEAQTNGSFSFTITPELGESGVDALPATYPATFYQRDGTTEETEVSLNSEGQIKLSGFKHGEKAVIHGLPIGTAWTIEETTTDGYVVKTEITVGETATSGTGAVTSGTITPGTTQVVYTNQQAYVLPETGGAGTTSYTMAGLMLMLCSAAYLLYRFRKRGREAC